MRDYLRGGVLFMSLFSQLVFGAEFRVDSVKFPNPKVDVMEVAGRQTAVLAGGCFWCTEALFEQLSGVRKVVAGYAGGTSETAHYEIVASGRTRHAEAIEITYDAGQISYGQILKIFFAVAHDPTQRNRQGPDHGPQYRSVIFYADQEQKRVAQLYIKQLDKAGVFDKPIVTEVVPLEKFFPAESDHQDFVKRNPRQGYVVVHALPKIKKVRELYPDRVKKE